MNIEPLALVQATAALQACCQQELSSIHSTIQVAEQLQMLDMSLPTPTYHALLSRDVLASVSLRTMGEYKLGWLKGLAHPDDQQASTLAVTSTSEGHTTGSCPLSVSAVLGPVWLYVCSNCISI